MMRQAYGFDKRLIALAIAAIMAVTALAQPTLGSPAETRPGAAAPASPCVGGTPTVFYNVTALPLPISYNRWGDMDLEGRLFAPRENVDPILEDVTTKLNAAGLGELAQPLAEMRDALANEDIAAATQAGVRFAEAAAAADGSLAPHARVTPTDLVQPLILRAHVGDCVVINVTNVMPEPTSIHVHAVVSQPGSGEAVGVQQADFANPGHTRSYTMRIPEWANMEGAHFLHSHVDSRHQTRHGLFGALVAEPKGSLWLSTADAQTPAPTGLEAIIVQPNAPDFREFVKIYHDEIELVNWKLESLPEIDDYHIYGPGTKGISLRSEPFMDRFQYHDELRAAGVLKRGHDKSQSYGSYTYGDPSTWIQKSYLGDPVKFRMINAGPGQHHIHHLHGGGIRWKSTPLAEPSEFAIGLVKDHPNQASASQRLDVQNAGPGESFTLEPEGGTGGVQQSAGDFLYHCHVAEHYLAGMWGIWRAFNTLQPGLAELPDRAGDHAWAVNSAGLIGLELPDGTVLDGDNVDDWVESFLPARGVPGEEDASVWDWDVEVRSTDGAPIYLGEPETALVWPTYPVDAPGRLPAGERPEIGFDPLTGKPAYPMLRPHLGARPPFAPEHGGAPFLKHSVTEQNPDGLCPAQARPLGYDVVAIQQPVKYNKFDTDVRGQVFVRTEDKHAVSTGATPATSLVLRANAGDCVDVTLTSELKEKDPGDTFKGIHTKTNIHIHLVQFDVQGSDGVVAGFNYETTLRSLNGSSSAKISRDPSAPVVTKIGQHGVRIDGIHSVVEVADVRPFFDKLGDAKVGSTVGLGLGLTSIESAKLVSVARNPAGHGGNVTLDRILQHQHFDGEHIGYEFVRYQWFPDVELGTVYFHDHVNGLDTWRHGLFGSLIIEPKDTRWLPPKRTSDAVPDDPVSHVVDIVSDDPAGPAYREIVLHFQDRACVNTSNDCVSHTAPRMPNLVSEPAAFNMRAEPLHRRHAEHPLWSKAFYGKDDPLTAIDDRTQLQGDPATMALEAYPGDDVVIRFLYTGQSMSRAVGTFGVTGHRFQQEQFLADGRTVDAISGAISSQHNLKLECGAGGCLRQPGDYLYYMTQPEYLQRGAWGLLRVHDPSDLTKVRPLPNNAQPTVGSIPAGAPVRYYDVSAIEGIVAHNPSAGLASQMRRYVLDSELPMLTPRGEASLTPPDPLVIRAHAGELVQVNLTNRMISGRVGLHAGMVSAGPADQGLNVGHNVDNTALPGERISYRWYADRELGAADLVSLIHPGHAEAGLTGALVIEPAGAGVSSYTGPAADIDLGNGLLAREHVLLFASPDAQFQSSTMPYLPDIAGVAMINYASEPLARRVGAFTPAALDALVPPVSGSGLSSCHVDPDTCMHPRNWEARNPFSGFATAGLAPWTPIVEAREGMPIILRAVGSSGDQLATVHFDGHFFATDPEMDDCRLDLSTCRSNVVSTVTVGPREVRNIWIPAAGPSGSGDYLYRNHRDAYFEAGAWGLLRVAPPGALPQVSGADVHLPALPAGLRVLE